MEREEKTGTQKKGTAAAYLAKALQVPYGRLGKTENHRFRVVAKKRFVAHKSPPSVSLAIL